MLYPVELRGHVKTLPLLRAQAIGEYEDQNSNWHDFLYRGGSFTTMDRGGFSRINDFGEVAAGEDISGWGWLPSPNSMLTIAVRGASNSAWRIASCWKVKCLK